MATVLLATDGSDDARAAADAALGVARERDAALHVVSVVDRRRVPETALSTDELVAIFADDAGFDHVDEVKERAAAAGLDASGNVLRGVPAATILAEAERRDADLIVLGEHGEHADHFGGVGRTVAAQADCEVIVVPARTRA